jgi:hypothetical protein
MSAPKKQKSNSGVAIASGVNERDANDKSSDSRRRLITTKQQFLPSVLVEIVLTFLTAPDSRGATLACKQWASAARSPRVLRCWLAHEGIDVAFPIAAPAFAPYMLRHWRNSSGATPLRFTSRREFDMYSGALATAAAKYATFQVAVPSAYAHEQVD